MEIQDRRQMYQEAPYVARRSLSGSGVILLSHLLRRDMEASGKYQTDFHSHSLETLTSDAAMTMTAACKTHESIAMFRCVARSCVATSALAGSAVAWSQPTDTDGTYYSSPPVRAERRITTNDTIRQRRKE